jgi:DNA-binding NarL/FixJ family response regulator
VIAVAIIAPSPVARAQLEAMLSRRPGLRVVGGLGTGFQEADVVLVDPGSRPIEALLRGLARGARLPLVTLLGADAVPVGAARLLRAGARGLLPRNATERELGACIEAVASGLMVLHPATAPASVVRAADGRRPAPERSAREPLTPRELEVLAMLADGLGNRAVAAALGITIHTVKFHVAAILDKLHARRRTDAVAIAMRLGVLLV